MTLDCVIIHSHYLVESVESHIASRIRLNERKLDSFKTREVPYIVVSVAQKLSEDVDCHYAKLPVGLDLEYCQYSLIKDRISDILGRIGVRSDLDIEVKRMRVDRVISKPVQGYHSWLH